MARHSVGSTDNLHLSVSMSTTTTLHFQMGKLKHSKVRTQGQCRGHLLISRLSAPLVDIMNCALSCTMSAPGQSHEGWPKAVLSSMCSYAEPAHSRHSPRSSGMNRCRFETHGWGQHSEAAPPAPYAHKQAGATSCESSGTVAGPGARAPGSASPCASCGHCKLHANHTQAATQGTKRHWKRNHFGPSS